MDNPKKHKAGGARALPHVSFEDVMGRVPGLRTKIGKMLSPNNLLRVGGVNKAFRDMSDGTTTPYSIHSRPDRPLRRVTTLREHAQVKKAREAVRRYHIFGLKYNQRFGERVGQDRFISREFPEGHTRRVYDNPQHSESMTRATMIRDFLRDKGISPFPEGIDRFIDSVELAPTDSSEDELILPVTLNMGTSNF